MFAKPGNHALAWDGIFLPGSGMMSVCRLHLGNDLCALNLVLVVRNVKRQQRHLDKEQSTRQKVKELALLK
jgi:hypothetical protein